MNRDGFTLIEVIVGMLIFTIGVLALASSTAFVSLQLNAAEVRTERSMAQQHAIERLRGIDFDSMKSVTKGNGSALGDYEVWWTVSALRWALNEVDIITEGPGYRDGRRDSAMVDTLTVQIPRPAL
jgi:prepilin-type N-terminal cleavage/methylation domain-containing protein